MRINCNIFLNTHKQKSNSVLYFPIKAKQIPENVFKADVICWLSCRVIIGKQFIIILRVSYLQGKEKHCSFKQPDMSDNRDFNKMLQNCESITSQQKSKPPENNSGFSNTSFLGLYITSLRNLIN